MSSRRLVDTEVAAFLETFPTLVITADPTEGPGDARRDAGAAAALAAVGSGGRGGVPAHRAIRMSACAPTEEQGAALRPAILHLHGGGYVMGNPEFMGPQCAVWADAFDAVVVAPAYRLAPETCFPGNVEDAYAALAWTVANAEALGIDTSRLALAGESAGGGLAASLALLVRDRRRIPLLPPAADLPDDR